LAQVEEPTHRRLIHKIKKKGYGINTRKSPKGEGHLRLLARNIKKPQQGGLS